MWPYTQDESNWLAADDQPWTTRTRPTIAEIELAARRYRAEVIGGWIAAAFTALGRRLRAIRDPAAAPPPRNAVGAD
jgi:hypothetical protein